MEKITIIDYECENNLGCQFHPEKNGDNGLAFLKNFCEI